MTDANETWTSRFGFILATAGSAIGIGSIWKFPYEVGANGGGAFVLVYGFGLVLVVVPLMFAEFAIGGRGHADSASSIAAIAREAQASRYWQFAGLLGATTCFLILSFYSVIGGWTLAYLTQTLWEGLPSSDVTAAQARFDSLLASPARMLIFHGLFIAMVAAVVVRGTRCATRDRVSLENSHALTCAAHGRASHLLNDRRRRGAYVTLLICTRSGPPHTARGA